MTQENINHQAVRSLINSLNKKTIHKFKVIFLANVLYKTSFGDFQDIIDVDLPIKGDDYHIEVSLDTMLKSDVFNVDDFHLGFRMKYSNMSFNSITNELLIKGNSPKMKGDYEVIIKEV
ncbi:hypothetical protein [Flavobacterium sp. LM4]|uniref:hypothetical protein n=1 Tax=Flavobacterium sp. LM4 TaxID=1938609 RepID=UPI0009933B81|nr:hypothetical protein [Flavobacterium sp. LM4]OOV17325.1 hypothetical protein BXU10_14560 [Flavobacterium sp. LM4]